MPQQPTQGGGPNQTLLELIYSLKGLAQTVEFFHQDLSRKLDEESKVNRRELDRIRDLVGKNTQALATLPIIFSDRAEKLINKMAADMGEKLRDVEDAVVEVRKSLDGYSRAAERAISHSEGVAEGIVESQDNDAADITGRIEVNDKGDIKVQVNSATLKKLWYALLVIAAGGGVYGIKQLVSAIFG
jgi:hypothetical protein